MFEKESLESVRDAVAMAECLSSGYEPVKTTIGAFVRATALWLADSQFGFKKVKSKSIVEFVMHGKFDDDSTRACGVICDADEKAVRIAAGEISHFLTVKNALYGESISKASPFVPTLPVTTACLVRAGDKIRRLESNSINDPEAGDALKDLVGYGVIYRWLKGRGE